MNKRRIGVRGIIYTDGKLLTVKHKKKDGTPAGFWAIPGGGLDPGEALEAGLQREIQEELGIRATIGRLLFIQQFRSTRADCDEELEFFFLIENSADFVTIDYSGTSHGMEELAACEFIDATREFVLPRFMSEIDLNAHVETVQPIVISNELQDR